MTGEVLLRAADTLIPGYSAMAEWGDCWSCPLERGTALEWATLAAVGRAAADGGWKEAFPLLERPYGRSLFTSHNQVPRQHPAKAGHSAPRQGNRELIDLFLQALIPKMVLTRLERTISVFREGCPYHMIAAGRDYGDRPDILLMDGSVDSGYPMIGSDGKTVMFAFTPWAGSKISGALSLLDSPTMPLEHRRPPQDIELPLAGIIECSMNKTYAVVMRQLPRYERLFCFDGKKPIVGLVLGNAIENVPWPHYVLQLKTRDARGLADQLLAAAAGLLREFSVL